MRPKVAMLSADCGRLSIQHVWRLRRWKSRVHAETPQGQRGGRRWAARPQGYNPKVRQVYSCGKEAVAKHVEGWTPVAKRRRKTGWRGEVLQAQDGVRSRSPEKQEKVRRYYTG